MQFYWIIMILWLHLDLFEEINTPCWGCLWSAVISVKGSKRVWSGCLFYEIHHSTLLDVLFFVYLPRSCVIYPLLFFFQHVWWGFSICNLQRSWLHQGRQLKSTLLICWLFICTWLLVLLYLVSFEIFQLIHALQHTKVYL